MRTVNDQVAERRYPVEGIRDDNDPIALSEGVGEQTPGTEKAQPPKGQGDHHFPAFFCGMPLDEDSKTEGEITRPPDELPGPHFQQEKVSVRPKQLMQ